MALWRTCFLLLHIIKPQRKSGEFRAKMCMECCKPTSWNSEYQLCTRYASCSCKEYQHAELILILNRQTKTALYRLVCIHCIRDYSNIHGNRIAHFMQSPSHILIYNQSIMLHYTLNTSTMCVLHYREYIFLLGIGVRIERI